LWAGDLPGILRIRSGSRRGEMFDVTTSMSEAGTLHLYLVGEFDLAGVPEVESALARAPAYTLEVEIDLSGLTFMDSSGVGCLLASAARCQGVQVSMHVVGADNPRISKVLAIAGVADRPPFSPGTASA